MADPFTQAAADILGSVLGRSATYTPISGPTVSLRVSLDLSLTAWGDAVEVTDDTASIELAAADVVARPKRGDRFDVDGEGWLVERTRDRDTYWYDCLVVRA